MDELICSNCGKNIEHLSPIAVKRFVGHFIGDCMLPIKALKANGEIITITPEKQKPVDD